MQGLLIAACLITVIYGKDVRPTVPQWPTAATFEFTMTDLTEDFELKVKSYYSAKKKAYRFDTWGGMNQAFVYHDTRTAYYYFPTAFNGSSQTECSQFAYNNPFVSPFPDLSQYKFAGNDSLYGVPSSKWVFKALFGRRQSTVWIQEREKPGSEGPFLAAADTIYYNVDNSLIENESSHPYVRYYNYVPGEPDSKVWTRPQMACTYADNDSVFLYHITSELLGNEYLILSPAAEGSSESQLRRDIYERNRRIVESHNELPSGYKLELNRFAHMTEKELKSYTGLRAGEYVGTSSPFPYSDEEVERMAKQLPESWDWRTRGAVTKVKDQRECGSCWAFSTIGGLEGANFLKTGELVELSEQFLVDCFWGDEANGCSGGLTGGALNWIMEVGGVVGEYQYGRYLAENGRCHMDKKQLIAPIKSFTQVTPSVNALKVALVHHGPIALGIAVMDEFFKYKNGVFKPLIWPFAANHGVVLVGYGVLNNDSYWLIKNSWAESWGLEGYGLISAENDAMCLLDTAFIIDMV